MVAIVPTLVASFQLNVLVLYTLRGQDRNLPLISDICGSTVAIVSCQQEKIVFERVRKILKDVTKLQKIIGRDEKAARNIV